MGTRSLTVVYDNQDNDIVCLYKQFDGYPSGMGMDLKNFLEGTKIVNGYTSEDELDIRTFNGMEDLAVRLITHLKNEEAKSKRVRGHFTKNMKFVNTKTKHPATGEDCIGQYYITKYDPKDFGWAEYVYHINQKENTVELTCWSVYKKKFIEIEKEKEQANG